jgi:hypothetical protein
MHGFDERTATMLAECARLVMDRWHGDLRRLREEANQTPESERELLKGCKGIGDVGTDIFFREVQGIWPEVRPFLDQRALDAAERLGLGSDVATVAHRVSADELPRLAAALVRVGRDRGVERLLAHRE